MRLLRIEVAWGAAHASASSRVSRDLSPDKHSDDNALGAARAHSLWSLCRDTLNFTCLEQIDLLAAPVKDRLHRGLT